MKLSDACGKSRHGLFFLFAMQTGLRPEEQIGLQWSNLEFADRGSVRVTKVIHHVRGGGWIWQEPKTKKSSRRVVFPGWLVSMLVDHRRKQLEQKLKAGRSWKDNDLVFPNRIGDPIRPGLLSRSFKALLIVAGLPCEVRQYDMRHLFVTASLIAGVDAKTVSSEAGHANVAFTLQQYGNVLSEMHVAASDKREELFKSRSGK